MNRYLASVLFWSVPFLWNRYLELAPPETGLVGGKISRAFLCCKGATLRGGLPLRTRLVSACLTPLRHAQSYVRKPNSVMALPPRAALHLYLTSWVWKEINSIQYLIHWPSFHPSRGVRPPWGGLPGVSSTHWWFFCRLFHKEQEAEKTTSTMCEEREVEVSKPTDRCSGSVKSSSTRESGFQKILKNLIFKTFCLRGKGTFPRSVASTLVGSKGLVLKYSFP